MEKELQAQQGENPKPMKLNPPEGHIGTWYVIDTEVIAVTKYFLLEHEEHGDEAASVIVDGDGKLVLDDVWNGFDDFAGIADELISDFE